MLPAFGVFRLTAFDLAIFEAVLVDKWAVLWVSLAIVSAPPTGGLAG